MGTPAEPSGRTGTRRIVPAPVLEMYTAPAKSLMPLEPMGSPAAGGSSSPPVSHALAIPVLTSTFQTLPAVSSAARNVPGLKGVTPLSDTAPAMSVTRDAVPSGGREFIERCSAGRDQRPVCTERHTQ